jgi:hypothetical protein
MEWYVDIRRSKVVAPAYVNWGSFIVDPWMSTWFCINHMLYLWGTVSQRSVMIVVVGQYPTIPLEIFSGIVCGPPMDSPVCDIAWKTCTRERWDPNRSYDVITKGCHTWLIRRRAYVVLVKFIPMYDLLLIQISTTLSNMSDSLFTAPTHRNTCFLMMMD